MRFASAFSKLGFDLPKFRFAIQTAGAAIAALLVAWAIGLEHPQWAAMTVWAASQPTRGQLLEKGFFRAGGTLLGVIAGIVIVLLSGGTPFGISLGLAIWVSACVATGNLLRGLTAYCAMLAGYSASMVALLDAGHPDQVFGLGLDRFATILTGVVAAVLIGWLFTPDAGEAEIVTRMRHMTARLLAALSKRFAEGGPRQLTAEEERILADMAQAEEQFDPHAAGSLRRRQATRSMRSILFAQISLLLAGRQMNAACDADVAKVLRQAGQLMESGESIEQALAEIDRAAGMLDGQGDVAEGLRGLKSAILSFRQQRDETMDPLPTAFPPVLHRDWRGAWQSALRTFVALGLVGVLWIVTGWAPFAFLMLGLSIMTSIFSTFDNPTGLLRYVFMGQAYGAIGAFICHFLVWPFASSEWQMVLMMVPFVAGSALFYAHRWTMMNAFDYAMVSLLLLKPSLPLTGSVSGWTLNAVAVVMAPAMAFVIYKAIYPINTRNRFNSMVRMAVDEIAMLAGADDALEHRLVWRARLYHRLLRLVRYGDRNGISTHEVAEGVVAILSLGRLVTGLKELLQGETASAAERRAARLILERLKHIQSEPLKVEIAIGRAIKNLGSKDKPAAGLLKETHDALVAQMDFLRTGSRVSA